MEKFKDYHYNMNRYTEYKKYLKNHISNVNVAFNYISNQVPSILDGVDIVKLKNNILNHDLSKYEVEELDPYNDYFYGEKNEKTKHGMDKAFLHHIHRNPHHWQYWILVHDDEPTEYIEIPKEYLIEMICDWMSFSINKKDWTEFADFYENNKGNIKMNDKSRKFLEECIQKIKESLGENNG